MGGADNSNLISVFPEELAFEFELEKPSSCNLKLVNNTEHHVAFKVKTTSPKKYFVRPNSSVVQPWDSSIVTVTLQAQREYPPDMQCKDKFLIQSTRVNPAEIDEIPADTFNKVGDKIVQEMKLRVIYKNPNMRSGGSGMATPVSRFSEEYSNTSGDEMLTIQRLREERDTTVHINKQLQRELEMLKKRKNKGGRGFSLKFAIIVGVLGLFVGFILNLSLTSVAPEE